MALLPPQLESLEEWMADQDEEMSRPEAIRRLVDIGLAAANRRRKGRGR